MAPSSYNRVAGQNVERLAALSDGIFAVAMTLLVIDLRAPAAETIHTERDLWHALLALSPRLLMYLMSFITLGIFWVGQQTQINNLERSERSLTWISHYVPLHHLPHAIHHHASGRAYATANVAVCLLAEHTSKWIGSLFLLGVCPGKQIDT